MIDESEPGIKTALPLLSFPKTMTYEGNAFDFNPATRAAATIPEAWRDLVKRRDVVLHELISATVEARTGTRPDPRAVSEFLFGLANPSHLETRRTSESHPGIRGPSIYPPPGGKGGS